MENPNTEDVLKNQPSETIFSKREIFSKILKALGNVVIAIFSIVLVFTLFSSDLQVQQSNKYFSKTIKTDIKSAILNGAQLDVIKHIYSTREIKLKTFIDIVPFIKKNENIYPEPTSLNVILYDLKKEYYLQNNLDSQFLNKLNFLINIQEEVNPFDKLATNQKFMFENIRQKLDTNYSKVKEDLNRIGDELSNKNSLVTEYLDKSNTSFWLSIIGLFATIILSTIQIYQGKLGSSKSFWNFFLKDKSDKYEKE